MPHQLEVVAPEPAPPSLLGRQPAASDTHVHSATTLKRLSSSAACTLVSQSCSASGGSNLPLRRRGDIARIVLALGEHLQHLIAVQRRSARATSRGEFASRDQLPISETPNQGSQPPEPG